MSHVRRSLRGIGVPRALVVPLLVLGLTAGVAGAETEDPPGPTLVLSAPAGPVEATDATGADVTYTVDSSDPTATVTCTPPDPAASGTGSLTTTIPLPLGTTSLHCTGEDSTGSHPANFSLVVQDTTPPTLSLPGPITVAATDAAGADVAYEATAQDAVAGSVPVSCDHPSGSHFDIGTTTVKCTATDGTNEASGEFTVTVSSAPPPADTTPPVFSNVPADFTVTTGDPTGTFVSYSAPTATDDGALVPVECNPASDTKFPVGATQVTCTARDASNNTAMASFTVTVTFVDATPPVFGSTPPDLTREATGPAGAVVTYAPPTAVDNGDPVAVTCSPPPGSTFALGATTVTCTAADAQGNQASVSFKITVVDTIGPVLTVPADITVGAASSEGTPRSSSTIAAFLTAAVATDVVDTSVEITTDAPATFPVGTTVVTFTARDDAGNAATKTARVTVLAPGSPPPSAPQPVDRTPPSDVQGLKAVAGSGRVSLSWTAPSSDFDHVVVLRATSAAPTANTQLYSGKAATYVDRGVRNDVEYRYTVIAYDDAGNRSAGAVVVATPHAPNLLKPANGARVKMKKPPLLVWRAFAGATYYNVQVFRVPGTTLNGATAPRADQKVMSAWPNRSRLQLKRVWKYNGRRYRLTPGTYRWYVWPGLGARSATTYGPLLGQQTFVVTR